MALSTLTRQALGSTKNCTVMRIMSIVFDNVFEILSENVIENSSTSRP